MRPRVRRQTAADADRAAFEALFTRTSQAVLAYLVRRVDDPADAADLLAEVYLVAWRRLEQVPVGDQGRLWLYGVARRVVSNHRRGQARRRQLADRLREHLQSTSMPAHEPSDEEARIHAALDQLSPTDKEILRLTAWEGLGAHEAAVVLGIGSDAARARLARARQRLRGVLTGVVIKPGRPGDLPAAKELRQST
jgi:RNA polymerase sigma-70 factor (ECF subfamily)